MRSGAGSGYRLIRSLAPSSPGSSGASYREQGGRSVSSSVRSMAPESQLAVPIENVLGLADPRGQDLSSGVNLNHLSGRPTAALPPAQSPQNATPGRSEAPEKSGCFLQVIQGSRLSSIHNLRPLYVDSHGATYFGSDQMKAALAPHSDFAALKHFGMRRRSKVDGHCFRVGTLCLGLFPSS